MDAVILAVTLSPLRNTHDAPQNPISEKMTAYTKPKVQSI